MRKFLIVASMAALAVPLIGAGTATAKPAQKIAICHFPGHVDPTNPEQPDFILDMSLDPAVAAAECTDLSGKILEVNPRAVSWADDESPHGHPVDPRDR